MRLSRRPDQVAARKSPELKGTAVPSRQIREKKSITKRYDP